MCTDVASSRRIQNVTEPTRKTARHGFAAVLRVRRVYRHLKRVVIRRDPRRPRGVRSPGPLSRLSRTGGGITDGRRGDVLQQLLMSCCTATAGTSSSARRQQRSLLAELPLRIRPQTAQQWHRCVDWPEHVVGPRRRRASASCHRHAIACYPK